MLHILAYALTIRSTGTTSAIPSQAQIQPYCNLHHASSSSSHPAWLISSASSCFSSADAKPYFMPVAMGNHPQTIFTRMCVCFSSDVHRGPALGCTNRWPAASRSSKRTRPSPRRPAISTLKFCPLKARPFFRPACFLPSSSFFSHPLPSSSASFYKHRIHQYVFTFLDHPSTT